MDKLTIVNMIPFSLSSEANQDSEPNLAVNPANTQQIAGTAFTPNPNGGPNSVIYISDDKGDTWTLVELIPGSPVRDQTLRFSWSNDYLYAALLWGPSYDIYQINYDVLRTKDLSGKTLMTLLSHRTGVDQPFIQAATVLQGADADKDRIYIGNNDWANWPNSPRTSSTDLSLDAGIQAPQFSTVRLDCRNPISSNGPPVRCAVHSDGTIYAGFYDWITYGDVGWGFPTGASDVVIVRDDNWGNSVNPFTALIDANDGKCGMRIAKDVNVEDGFYLAQQRIGGGNLSIAVDPNDSSNIYAAWEQIAAVGNVMSSILHVTNSHDRGAHWSANDLRTILNATNPALAVSGDGRVGFLYQQLYQRPVLGGPPTLTGYPFYRTTLELTFDDFGHIDTYVLSDTPADTPVSQWDPYLGDYLYLMSVGVEFFGIFCANNTPNPSNFPSVKPQYQRQIDWTNHLLKDLGGNNVPASIDPFFFRLENPFRNPRLIINPEVKVGANIANKPVNLLSFITDTGYLTKPFSYDWTVQGGIPTTPLNGQQITVIMPAAGNIVQLTLTVTDKKGFQLLASRQILSS